MNFETFKPKEENPLSKELEEVEALILKEENSGKNLHSDEESHEYFKLIDKRNELLAELRISNHSDLSEKVETSIASGKEVEVKETPADIKEPSFVAPERIFNVFNKDNYAAEEESEAEKIKRIKRENTGPEEDKDLTKEPEKVLVNERMFPFLNKDVENNFESLSPEKKTLFKRFKESLMKKETQKKIILISLAIGVSVVVPPASIMMGGGLFGLGAGLSVPFFEALGLASYSAIIGGPLGSVLLFNAIEKGAGLFSRKGKNQNKEINPKETVAEVEKAVSAISDEKESILSKLKTLLKGNQENTSIGTVTEKELEELPGVTELEEGAEFEKVPGVTELPEGAEFEKESILSKLKTLLKGNPENTSIGTVTEKESEKLPGVTELEEGAEFEKVPGVTELEEGAVEKEVLPETSSEKFETKRTIFFNRVKSQYTFEDEKGKRILNKLGSNAKEGKTLIIGDDINMLLDTETITKIKDGFEVQYPEGSVRKAWIRDKITGKNILVRFLEEDGKEDEQYEEIREKVKEGQTIIFDEATREFILVDVGKEKESILARLRNFFREKEEAEDSKTEVSGKIKE